MRLAVLFSGALLGLLAGREKGDEGEGAPGKEPAPGLLTSVSSESPGDRE